MTEEEILRALLFFLFAFVPPVVYLVWIRNTEKREREPWGALAKAFAWGSISAILIAVILSTIFVYIYEIGSIRIYESYGRNPTADLLVLSVIIAPLTEEFAKGIGVYTARAEINEPEDGLVYGAACGLGFSATENLFYGYIAFLTGGWFTFIVLIVMRSLASTLVHASASSIMGYGIGRSILWKEHGHVMLYYLGAVAIHGAFNFVASLGTIYEGIYGAYDPNTIPMHLIALFMAMIFAAMSIGLMRRKIMTLESADRKYMPYQNAR